MYPNDFSNRENYCNNCNSDYNEVKQLCTANNMRRMLDQRSSFDQYYVPRYNQLALNTLTYPALHPDSMPELSPFAGYDINGQVAQPARMWPKNEFGQYGASGLAPRGKMRFVTPKPRPYTLKPRPYTLKPRPYSPSPPPGFRGDGPHNYKEPVGAAVPCSKEPACAAVPCCCKVASQFAINFKEFCLAYPDCCGAVEKGGGGKIRENYGGSKLKDLKLDVYVSGSCGHCLRLKKMLKDAGELENVNLKDVSKAEHSAEMKDKKLGGGVPVIVSLATGKKMVGAPQSIEALVAKLS